MSFTKIFSVLIFICCLASCDKDRVNLEGPWDVTKVEGQHFTDGVPSFISTDDDVIGFVRFGSNGAGELDYDIDIFSYISGPDYFFTYTANDSEICVTKENSFVENCWTRILNEKNKQKFSFDLRVSANTIVTYSITLEK